MATLVKARFALVWALVCAGIAAGAAFGFRDSDGAGPGRVVQPLSTVTGGQSGLADWLSDLHQRFAIGPNQEAAWRHYADAVRALHQARLQARDTDMAPLARALDDLQDRLSPQQMSELRLATQVLADDATCRGLSIQ